MSLALEPRAGLAAAPARARPSPAEIEAATAIALTEGGDDRLGLNPEGRNRYGCAPRPDAALLDFASSTASVISAHAFQAAGALHTRLIERPDCRRDVEARLLRDLAVLSGAARIDGVRIRLAASGTDVHRLAVHIAAGAAAPHREPRAVMAEPDETGSGVPGALGSTLTVRLREADGAPRDAKAVDADFAAAVEGVLRSDRRCLLVLTDVSKSGLVAPSPEAAIELQQRFGSRLDVLVDACQLRLAPASLARYLACGFMVAITGSKFVTGPAFSGALLVPPALADRTFAFRDAAPASTGLLLRWQAALSEMQRFHAVPPARVRGFLLRWGHSVAEHIASDPHFAALPVRPITRSEGGDGSGWDALQTIFPFTLQRGPAAPLARDETARLHRWLQSGARIHLGQPVACGVRAGVPVSALRLCASVRWVAEAAQSEAATQRAIDGARLALQTLANRIDQEAP